MILKLQKNWTNLWQKLRIFVIFCAVCQGVVWQANVACKPMHKIAHSQGCAIVSLLRGILVLILHFYNSIGIVIEIGTAKKPRTILLLVLVLQFKLSQYWYWYCYWITHSVSIDIGIVIARHLQQILPTLLVLQNNFSSIEERIA